TLGVAAVRVSAQKAVALDERRAATAARDDAEAARDALVLRNAELLLTRDPTRARQALAGYDGPDRAAAAFYDALARAAGSAERELTPHADAIFGVATAPGDAIISAGDDGAVKVTREDGSIETIETVPTISSPIALSAATGCVATVEPDRRLRLRCPPDFTPIAVPDVDAARIAFSPDGGTLVTLAEGKLVVWRVEQDPELRLERSGAAAMLAGDEVTFAGPSTILRVRDHDVTAMPTHGMEAPSSAKLTFARPIDAVAASSRLAAVVTNDDQMQLLSLPELHPLRTLRPCDADVVEVVVAAESPSFSVACSDGKVVTGDVWGRQSVSFVTIRRPSLLAISDAGTLVSVTDATNVLYVHDVERNLTWTLRGHETGITYARLPDRRDDRVITGDAGGTIRIWRLPDPLGHVACTVPTVPFHARLLPDEASVVVDGEDGVVRVCGAGGNVEALPGRAELYYGLVLDEQGTMVAASGLDVVSVWRVDDHRLLRQFRGHHGQTAARFLRDGSLLSWGEDGDVWRWSAAGDEASMLSLADFPIASFRWVGASNEIMFAGRRGPVMVAGLDGSASRVVQPSSDDLLTALGISRGATWVVTGDEHGTVRVNGPDATTPSRLHLDAPIHRVAVAPSGQYWAATTERGRLVLATTAPTSGEGTLLDFSIGARGVAFSADGNVLAVPLASGTVCFLHIATIDWQCSASTGAELLSGNFDREDRHFIAVDSEGRVIDLGMTNLFETTGPDDN
ncbi:MAG: WD40 repeat domain-containing protein, partial [Myxococcales bacterium]|nr:WD40 repeat domain-containing protein [Myxococcales bacterium]